jgi:hypothetical protein
VLWPCRRLAPSCAWQCVCCIPVVLSNISSCDRVRGTVATATAGRHPSDCAAAQRRISHWLLHRCGFISSLLGAHQARHILYTLAVRLSTHRLLSDQCCNVTAGHLLDVPPGDAPSEAEFLQQLQYILGGHTGRRHVAAGPGQSQPSGSHAGAVDTEMPDLVADSGSSEVPVTHVTLLSETSRVKVGHVTICSFHVDVA